MMTSEHEAAGAMLAEIRRLSDNYTTPVGACPTYQAYYDGLREFEQDLHQHIHLENNILFPRAIAMERAEVGDGEDLVIEFAVPGFEDSFEFEHESAGVRAVDEAVVEAEAIHLDGADGDCVVAFGVGEDDGLFAEAADGEDGGLRLVDDGGAELAAEDAGVGEGKGRAGGFFGQKLFGAGAECEVGEGAGEIDEGALLGLADDGHDESPLEGDGDAEMDVLVVLDGRADERGVDDGEAAEGFNGRCGDEGHVGEVEAVALLEGGFLALAEADDAGHVHLVDGVDVGAGADALDHALGDDGAHFGHGDEVA